MCRLILLLTVSAVSAIGAVSKTAIDLMNEGRFKEARVILKDNAAGARYLALLGAMTEPDGREACRLYREVSANYPDTDCDSVAQARLLLALEMGIPITSEEEPSPLEAEPDLEVASMEMVPAETVAEAGETTPPADEPASAVTEETSVGMPALQTPEIEPASSEVVVNESAETGTESQDPPEEDSQEIDETVLESSEPTEPAREMIASTSLETANESEPSAGAPETTSEVESDRGLTVDYQADAPAEETEIQQAAVSSQDLLVKSEPETSPETDQEEMTERAGESAQEMAALVEDKGVVPIPDPGVPQDVEATPAGDYFVQVGAFGNHENALRLAAKLRSAGYPVVLVPRETETVTLMQVRVGGFRTTDDCRGIAGELETRFNVPAMVIHK